jgi:hypothetical protein
MNWFVSHFCSLLSWLFIRFFINSFNLFGMLLYLCAYFFFPFGLLFFTPLRLLFSYKNIYKTYKTTYVLFNISINLFDDDVIFFIWNGSSLGYFSRNRQRPFVYMQKYASTPVPYVSLTFCSKRVRASRVIYSQLSFWALCALLRLVAHSKIPL